MFTQAFRKLRDSALAVFPVLLVVLILYFTKLVQLNSKELVVFLVSVVFVVLGMWAFSIGADSSMSKMGELVGSSITKKQSMVLLIVVFFLFGAFITIAEPDLSVLAEQVPGINSYVLIISIGLGVGFFLVIGALRILFQKSLKVWLLAFYGLMFAICCLIDYSYIPLALDSGGVTTGPITVPFILAVGIGIASSRAGNKSDADSFGLVAFSSIGPILVVLILSLFIRNSSLTYAFEQAVINDYISPFTSIILTTVIKVLISILPILIFFLVYNFIFLKLPKRKIVGILIGVVTVIIGLTLFLIAVEAGFLPIGQKLGIDLANNDSARWILIVVGASLGIAAAFAEPAVHVLTNQIEEVSEGAVHKNAVLIAIAIGNGLAIALSVTRVIFGFNLFYIIVPGYCLAFLLSFLVPDIYFAIAFDSGGVVSGPMNTTFIIPYLIGICSILEPDKIMTDAFGTIAIVALMPLLMIQGLGLTATIRIQNQYRIARKRIKEEYDDQIIHF